MAITTFIGILFSPVLIFLLAKIINNPKLSLVVYATYSFYFCYVSRYLHREGLSVGLDIFLVFTTFALLLDATRERSQYSIKRGINVYTLSYIFWIFLILFEFLNFGTSNEAINKSIRTWCVSNMVLYFTTSIILNNTKAIKYSLVIGGLLVLSAFIKLMWQKNIGFDSGERYWLYVQGASRTHIVYSGIRYFSFFSDAGNFGPYMGMISIIYGIIGFTSSEIRWKIFCICVFLMGLIGMFMSGTRSAMIVPFGGLLLYTLLCKKIKIMIPTILLGICVYIFFAFTNIGEGNSFVRRMRTSFHAKEDPSYQTRKRNQKEIAKYIKIHPWGAGIGGGIPKIWLIGEQYVKGTIPPDSFYVSIWIQTGTYGLILYISILCAILIRSCWIVFVSIKNEKLRQIMAAFTCALFGIYLNGHSGEAMGMPPTNFLITLLVCFVMNGTYIDKQLKKDEIII